jgi:hypothetical protein
MEAWFPRRPHAGRLVSEKPVCRKPGFLEGTPSPQRKVAGWSSEAMAVDRDLTVTQVNNCEQPASEVGLDKRFLNNQIRLQTPVS